MSSSVPMSFGYVLIATAHEQARKKMKSAEIDIQSSQMQCPRCRAAMQLVRHIDLRGLPNIYIYYCSGCQHVETVKEERAA
jgi:hypothetical protein